MIKNILSCIFVFSLMLSVSSFAQNEFYLGMHMDTKIPIDNVFLKDNKVLKSRLFSPFLAGSLSAHWRWHDAIELEIGISQHYDLHRFKDVNFEERYDGFTVKLNQNNYYYSYYAALRSLIRIGRSNSFLYLQCAYGINEYNAQTVQQTKEFIKENTNDEELVTYQASFKQSNNFITPEIGLQMRMANRHFISIGIKASFGQNDLINASYQVENDSLILATDQLTSWGSSAGLTFSYNHMLFRIPKKEKERKKKEKRKKEKQPKVIAKKTMPKKVEKPEQPKKQEIKTDKPKPKKAPKKIEGRNLQVNHKIKVNSKHLTIKVWDHQKIDGDRISLNLNGKWILEDYTLEKQVYEFQIELEEGTNMFVLHALNLGRYEPNTAAIIIDDGTKSNMIVLESTLETSDTIEITYKPKK